MLIGVIQLYATFELTRLSSRSAGVSFQWATQLNYWLPSMLTFAVPYINGDLSDHTYVGRGLFWEDYSYTGLVTLVLAFTALTAIRTRGVRFFWASAVLALLMVVGKHTPFFELAFRFSPGSSFFRLPTRFLFVTHLALCLLAALGLTRLETWLKARPSMQTSRLAPVIAWLVVGISFVDLQYFQLRQNAIADATREHRGRKNVPPSRGSALLAPMETSSNAAQRRLHYISPLTLLVPLATTVVGYVIQNLILFSFYARYFDSPTFSPYAFVDFLLYLAASYVCFMFARRALPFVIGQASVMAFLIVATMEKTSQIGDSLRVTDVQLLPELFGVLSTELKLLYFGGTGVALVVGLGMIIANFRLPSPLDFICLLPAAAALTVATSLPIDAARKPLSKEVVLMPWDTRGGADDLVYRGILLNFWLESRRVLSYRFREDPARIERAIHELTAGYDLDRGQPEASAPKPTRNVYLIVLESFWNPERILHYEPTSGEYLSREYKELWRESGGGFSMMPVFASGTSNSEFEVICGQPAELFTTGIIFTSIDVRPLNCLPALLSKLGYHTLAIHPGSRNFYKRDRLCPALGFQE